MQMKKQDSIIFEDLSFYGYHGIMKEEKKIGQEFLLDIELFCSLEKAGENDNLEYSIDYAAVYSMVKQIVEEEQYDLIEALAERIAADVLENYRMVEEIDVGVKKPGAPLPGSFGYVGVKVSRRR